MSGPLGSAQWMYASGAEVTQQSLKFNDDESQYLSWTPAAAGNRKTWTWSGWVKRGNLDGYPNFWASGSGTASDGYAAARFQNDGVLLIFSNTANTTNNLQLNTTAKFRDPSAWYHVVISIDTTQATASDRAKIYVNGIHVTDFTTAVYPSQNFDLQWNTNTKQLAIGADVRSTPTYFYDGYLSDVYFIDGQALDASSFGQFTNGYWEKIDYAGTYGTNGFHLTFQDDVVSEGFNAVTYRGTGGSQSVSGLGLNPDLVWIKNRGGTNSHILQDSIRGAGKSLFSNATNAESGNSGDLIASFDSDGFSVNDTYLGGSGGGGTNGSGGSYVAWAWDAGSGSPVSNTDGSITSTVKANPSYGFSIVSYVGNGSTGQSVGTGLSSSDLVIIKNRSATASWHVLTGATTPAISGNTFSLDSGTNRLNLNLTNGYASYGMDAQTNANGNNYIAYCFHSVAGYSSIGSYSGTGAAGNSITGLGFKPAFLLIKRTDAANNWVMLDNTRDTNDALVEKNLYADTSGAEAVYTYEKASFDNDGFTLTNIGASMNASGGSYIYVAFGDQREAAFWKDVSGQGNHWTPNNLDYRDSLIDSPANNFAVLNPLNAYRSGNVYSEGNLRAVPTSTYNLAYATMAQSTGKWYWEIYVEHRVITNNNTAIGLEEMPASSSYLTKGYWDFGGTRNDGSIVASDGTYPSFATGDVISVAVDFDNGKLWFAHNGSWVNSGDPSAGTNNPLSTTVGSTYSPAFFLYYTATIPKFIANFGQDSTFSGNRVAGGNQDDNGIGDFAYAPPSGYLALCTANLPTPTIVDGSEHFNTVLYNGTGSSNAVTGVGFQNDLLWIKSRSDPAGTHRLIDSVRGGSLALQSDTTGSEIDNSAQVTSPRDADGFTVDGNTSAFNQSGDTYVAWNWKAGGTAVSNTAGSITSQVSANTDAGFSIVSYTGTSSAGTIGHGLSSAPEMIIVKNRDVARNWGVYHAYNTSAPETDYLLLNLTDATDDSALPWNDIAPTSSVFSVGTSVFSNRPSEDFIAYCFHSVEGFSKAGSYTGNGSADGPFIFTGFRPAWVMVKRAVGGTSNWDVMDAVRNTYNIVDKRLYANLDDAEPAATDYVDFTSNGFKVRNTATSQNASGSTYIFLAFAENPFKYANAR